jgi:hypothetical protein
MIINGLTGYLVNQCKRFPQVAMRRIFRSVSLVYLSATTRKPSTVGAEFQKSVFIDKLTSIPAQIRSTDFASEWQMGLPPRYTPALSMLDTSLSVALQERSRSYCQPESSRILALNEKKEILDVVSTIDSDFSHLSVFVI